MVIDDLFSMSQMKLESVKSLVNGAGYQSMRILNDCISFPNTMRIIIIFSETCKFNVDILEIVSQNGIPTLLCNRKEIVTRLILEDKDNGTVLKRFTYVENPLYKMTNDIEIIINSTTVIVNHN